MSFVQITPVETHSVRWRSDALIPKEGMLQEGMLHFPIETLGVLTPFREQVLSYLYRTTLGLSNGLLESAIVEAVSETDEGDSLHLHLALTINMDWEELDKLHDEILSRIAAWSEDWQDDKQEEYGRWIYFSLTPSRI